MAYHIGEVVPSHFDPGIVAGSYIASLCGCLLTVELLHRRDTGLHKWKSWLDTVACATTLGLVGIWCMHFIGNRAIIMGSGASDIQLVYAPRFSVLSVFLPIIGLCIAFTTAEYPFKSSTMQKFALCCTGIFAGLSVVGMHYMGNFGISNYNLNYRGRFLAASIIIAIGDCLTVLALFYNWRDKWISDWRKRALCAVLLAAGVTAMHFTASTKCIYTLTAFHGEAAIRSRNAQVIIAGVLCGTAALVVGIVLYFTRRRQATLKKSAQKVMLSCAVFTSDGRILVTTEGVLPSHEITDKFQPRTFDDEFDITHPVFQWMFRVSRNWSAVTDLVPRMKAHLNLFKGNSVNWEGNQNSPVIGEHNEAAKYSLIFREQFCTAAYALATAMHVSLDSMGVLFDKIVDTGTLIGEDSTAWHDSRRVNTSVRDLESTIGVPGFGKGQLLFLTRVLKEDDHDKFLNAGYKFANLQQVDRNIAQNMQIPLAALDAHIQALKDYNDKLQNLVKRGTWIGCFAMIPKPGTKGFDVAVKSSDNEQLPDVELQPYDPLAWQSEFLQRMHQKTPAQCITFLNQSINSDVDRTLEEPRFAIAILQAITTLFQQLPQQWMYSAKFCGTAVHPHYTRPRFNYAPLTTLFSFVVYADMHASLDPYPSITRAPLSFFSARHQCYFGSPHHCALSQEIHKEFGPLLARLTPTRAKPKNSDKANQTANNGSSGNAKRIRKTSSIPNSIARSGADNHSESSSETYELDDMPPTNRIQAGNRASHLSERETRHGGILVNSETVIESGIKNDFHDTLTSDLGFGVGMRVAVGTTKPDETFVDELCAFARSTISSKGSH